MSLATLRASLKVATAPFTFLCDERLDARGYSVTGIDGSEQMMRFDLVVST